MRNPSPSSPPTAGASIQYNGIQFSKDAITYLDYGRVVKSFPRQTIQRVVLKTAPHSAHPVLQSLLGLGLALIGLWDALAVLNWVLNGTTTIFSWILRLMWLLPFGIWVIVDGLRQELCIEVWLETTHHKLVFQQKPDRKTVRQFAQTVRQRLGYTIEEALPNE